MKLALDDLKLGAGTQPRAKIDEAVVADYAEAMREGAAFPPVVAFFDGEIYYLADGFHRVDAAYKLGLDAIEAEVKQGTHRDAIYYSLGANADHGLRRTAEDKRRAVMRMLEDKDWKCWPQGEIAKACRVSRKFVNDLLTDPKSGCHRLQPEEKVIGSDGKAYPSARPARAPAPVVNEMPLDDELEPTEEEYAASMESEPEPEASQSGAQPDPEPKPAEIPTTPDHVINALRNYIDVILDELDSDTARHYAVNETIKYLREKSIALNRAS
ncbi:MAG: ParB N-terminal domain-containing protein [Elusimicrobia bacterium]|nr:ParB N-terminal domain-containing protein [Elusimicrobiota bacterium]